MSMRPRFIPTRVHGLLDYGWALLVLAAPWVFQFDHGSAETWFSLVVAAVTMLISLFTDYEWGVSRTIPMPVHLLFDVAGGVLLALSPWLFKFASVVYLPHVILGIIAILVPLFTSPHSTDASLANVKRLQICIIPMLCAQLSCDRAESSTYIVTTLAGQRMHITPEAALFGTIPGFRDPESVLFDAEQDVIFVSNMHGAGSDKDGRGYIVRLSAGDYSGGVIFAEGAKNGVELNAPKGMTLRDSVLWVTDIDVLRGFDKRTGRPAGTIDLRPYGAILLNDVATGPNGELYVTDTAIRMTVKGTIYESNDRIFSVGRDGRVGVVAQGDQLKSPNGIKWHPQRQRWIVAGFDPFESVVYELPQEIGGAPKIIARGWGNFDGLEILQDGSIVVTSWDDSSLHIIRDGRHYRIAGNLHQPADLGLDTRRNRLLIPSVILGRVEVWQLVK